jgi:heat shock protein HtpX
MYTQISSNKQKTVLLITGFVAFIAALGWLFSRILDSPGMLWFALIFGLVYAAVGYFASARIALALSGAKPVSKQQAPQLYRIVENLSITAGLPMPAVYIINDSSPNAFATGRDPKHAAVAVTTGLLESLEDEELEGVLAHELSHIGNYDIRVMAIVIVLATVISVLADFFFRFSLFGGGDDDDNSSGGGWLTLIGVAMSLLAPLVATVLQLAVSRQREFLADASGVLLTRYPDGLARALAKIAASKPMHTASTATAHLYFASPFKGRTANAIARLFSTHPPIEERIARLQSMDNTGSK